MGTGTRGCGSTGAALMAVVVALPGCFLTDARLREMFGDSGGDSTTGGDADTDLAFVTIPAQNFDMGCTPGQEDCEDDETPVMPVTLTRDFQVSRTEVTQAQFSALVGYSPSFLDDCGPDCPVGGVSWYEAAAFANAVSAAEGLPACYSCSGNESDTRCEDSVDPYTCEGYRLLTEAEWEAAARCGEDTLYAGSDDASAVAWTSDNANKASHPVAELAANGCGVYDMSGNVAEWVQDWYDDTYYRPTGRTDPTGSSADEYLHRGCRGGSWANPPLYARVASRSSMTAYMSSPGVGFRLARSVR